MAGVIPLAAGAHAFGYYASRSGIAQRAVSELGMAHSDVSLLYSGAAAAGAAGVVGGLLLGALLGPLPVAALGLVVYAFAAAGQSGASSGAALATTFALASFGAGLYRPAVLYAVLRPFGRGGESMRTAGAAAMYGMTNLAAIPGPFIANGLQNMLGSVVSAGVGALSAVLSGAVGMVMLALLGTTFMPAWGSSAWDDRSLEGRGLAWSAGTVVVAALGLGVWSFGGDQFWNATIEAGVSQMAMTVNPLVVSCTALVVVIGHVIAAVFSVEIPALMVSGVGFLLLGASLAPTAVMPLDSTAAFVAATSVGGVGEVLAWSGAFSRAAGGNHYRVAMVAVGLLTLSSSASSLFGRLPGLSDIPPDMSAYVASGCGVVVTLVGVALLVGGFLGRDKA